MNPTLKIGGSGLILCSGGVFTLNDEPLEIGLREDGSNDVMYKLRFVFQNEPQRGEGDFSVRAKPAERCSEITIFNCNATSGSGVLSPLRIATNANGENLKFESHTLFGHAISLPCVTAFLVIGGVSCALIAARCIWRAFVYRDKLTCGYFEQ